MVVKNLVFTFDTVNINNKYFLIIRKQKLKNTLFVNLNKHLVYTLS